MPNINHAGSDLIFELGDRPPFHQTLIDATTHLLAVFVPMVTPALIVGAVLQLSVKATAHLASMAMAASGIGTWLQVNRYGIVGSGLLSIQPVDLLFVTVVIVLGNNMKSDGFHEESIMSSLSGISFVGAFLVIGSSFILSYLRQVITPTVSGIMMLMIGLSLIKVGTIDLGGGFAAKNSGTFGNYEHLDVGLLVLIVVIGFNCCRSPLLRMGGITVGLCVGHVASLCLGMMGFSSMCNLSPTIIPHPFEYSFSFSLHQFLAVGMTCLFSILEAVDNIIATTVVSRRSIQGEEYQSRPGDGVLADGLASIIVSAVGSLPLVTFVQSNGVIQMTGIASRYAGRTIAVILVILGLSPVTGGFFTTIPSAVPGGAMTLMFPMIVIAGIRIIITNSLRCRETLVVATSLDLRLGASYDLEILRTPPASIYILVGNPICVGGLTAILLDIIPPDGYRQENVLPSITSAGEMD